MNYTEDEKAGVRRKQSPQRRGSRLLNKVAKLEGVIRDLQEQLESARKTNKELKSAEREYLAERKRLERAYDRHVAYCKKHHEDARTINRQILSMKSLLEYYKDFRDRFQDLAELSFDILEVERMHHKLEQAMMFAQLARVTRERDWLKQLLLESDWDEETLDMALSPEEMSEEPDD